MFLIVSKRACLIDFSLSCIMNCLYLTTICTVIDRDKIKINIIKFDEITVTFQFIKDTVPIITINEAKQLDIHASIHSGFLKTMKRTAKIKTRAPNPKTNISFLTYVIVSSAIIDTPPRCISRLFSKVFIIFLISLILL